VDYAIRVERQPARQLAVVRRRTTFRELPQVVPAACGEVWGVMKALQVGGLGRHVAIYWDDQVNLEVGVEVASPFAGHGQVHGSATPEGMAATTTHFGPYHQLHEAHLAVRKWCEAHGRKLAGPNWEIYDHWKDEYKTDPSKIRTDMYYLLVDE
jgi:effector-binding domain-containing protein